MLYQLTSGKVIYLSVEDYLSLSDKELHELANSGYGDEPSYNTTFSSKTKQTKEETSTKQELDYSPENDDEIDITGPIDLNNLPEETAD